MGGCRGGRGGGRGPGCEREGRGVVDLRGCIYMLRTLLLLRTASRSRECTYYSLYLTLVEYAVRLAWVAGTWCVWWWNGEAELSTPCPILDTEDVARQRANQPNTHGGSRPVCKSHPTSCFCFGVAADSPAAICQLLLAAARPSCSRPSRLLRKIEKGRKKTREQGRAGGQDPGPGTQTT